MADHSSSRYATVVLEELDSREPIPKRVVTLEAPDWEIRIGRGTNARIEQLTPAKDNAWFDSRVLSRRHAILRANPTVKAIYIQDIGSMHGTFVAGKRLNTDSMKTLWPEDTVTLGCDVIRGSSHFSALRFKVTWSWHNGTSPKPDTNQTSAGMYRNTFSADYSDEEAYADLSVHTSSDPEEDDYEPYENGNDRHSEPEDEVQAVQDSGREPSIDIVIPDVRTFAVPESDAVSNTPSHASGADVSDKDSPISSPLIPSNIHEDKVAALEELSHPLQDARNDVISPDHSDHSQVLVPSSAQQAELLPTVDEDVPEEDSYEDDGLESVNSEDVIRAMNLEPSFEFTMLEVPPNSSSSVRDYPGHVRAPSPSDAAMVKPSIESGLRTTLPAPPFSTLDSSEQQPAFDDRDPAPGRSSSAWAGHNSVLYEPVAQQLVPEHSAPVYYPPFGRYTPLYTDSFAFQPLTAPSQAPPPSPLSIASVVPQQQADKDVDGAKKRKADKISSDEGLVPNTASSDSYSSKVGDLLATTATNEVGGASSVTGDTLPNSSTSAVEVTETTPANDIDMPARKKAKKNKVKAPEQHVTGSHSLAKTAGAAIAGMAIGAVGMFIGLLALPEDYFM